SLAKADVAQLTAAALDPFPREEPQWGIGTYWGWPGARGGLGALVGSGAKGVAETIPAQADLRKAFNLLKRTRFAFGTACIFLYVGAEVSIGSVIVNYLMQANTLGLPAEEAGKHVPFYWGGALVGRFIGAFVLKYVSPGKVLAFNARRGVVSLLVSANTVGAVSGWSLLAIGLFNSIMFPTIFALASEGLGPRTADGSGVLCVAIVGGAIVPVITGAAADVIGLKAAMI